MKTSDFWYDLPDKLIAQHPAQKRDQSKLLVLDKNTGKIEHKIFSNVIDYLNPGDCLVINNTKVIPARLIGSKVSQNSSAAFEFLLLKNIGENTWQVLAKPGKRVKIGDKFVFGDSLYANVLDVTASGERIIKFEYDGIWEEVLDKVGQMPLPPYITEKLQDKSRYQTVYSKESGSAAAPTAGLHFTKELLEKIEQKGIKIVPVLLHVGLGTFRPVKSDDISQHKMHSEFIKITQEAADIINNTKKSGGKIVCVGTTSVRALESAIDKDGKVMPIQKETDIFITPPYDFKAVDSLITNFHLPESTLLMLVSALASKEIIFNAYDEAIKNEYRFFSFGDAMIIK